MADEKREEAAETPGDSTEAPEEGGVEDLDFEEAVSELESVESSRRRFFLAAGIGAFVLLAATIISIAEFKEWFFQPEMPIEETRREIVRKTDDPQCRELIAEVTNIGNTFFAMERRIEAAVPGGGYREIRNLDRELATLKKRLDEAEKVGEAANLRFEDSRKELDRWFDYVDNEIWVLRDVLADQMKRLGPPSTDAGDAGRPGDVGGDVGTAEVGSRADTGSSPRENSRSPAERTSGALVALHDAFENFRVWHTADLHPCGDAGKGETPWRPDDWKAAPDAGTRGGAG